jgi:hypothetical protein
MVAGVIRTGIGPLAGDGLDEPFGLAVGLWTVRLGEEMAQAEFLAGGGEEFGAISGAAVGEDTLDLNAMSFVELDGLVECGEHAGRLFIGMKRGEGEAGMVVDGDVEALDAGAGIALGTIAGGAHPWAFEAAQLLDVEVEKVARGVAFVTDGRWLGRLQGGEAVEMVAAQNAGESGFGNWQSDDDLSIGTALAAQVEDLDFELGRGPARLTSGSRGMVVEALGKPGFLGAREPAADGLFTDPVGEGRLTQSAPEVHMLTGHLSSRERGKFGISVHVVRAGERAVECASTTSLSCPSRADNVLKHDT